MALFVMCHIITECYVIVLCYEKEGRLTAWIDHVDQSSKHHTVCTCLLSNRFRSRYGPMIDIKARLDNC